MKVNILLVEDNREISYAIKEYLTKSDINVDLAFTGVEGIEKYNKNSDKYQLIIIDIMLPIMNGFELCKNIRIKSEVPIIILSAKFNEKDKVKGLEYGADDYLTKPFSLAELKARIGSQIRRFKRYSDKKEKYDCIAFYGGLRIYPEIKRIEIENETVFLTSKEYDLLMLFLKNPFKIFSKKECYESVWGGVDVEGNNTVLVHIRSLREKIRDNIKTPKYIKTIWGSGYSFIGERIK